MTFEIGSFRELLLAWYDRTHRKLPWRKTDDPYAILVSEIMLQQTQVKTVIPYYHRFLARFPTVRSLAEVGEQELLKMWQGLGYYRRAKHLQEAARQIVAEHHGRFPRTKQEIDALKGVGPYTSAAVASIALGLKWACVDGNVIRVVTRLNAIDDDVQSSRTKSAIQEKVQEWIPDSRPGDFNQAMMELGATVCTPVKPACMTCPVKSLCQTFREGGDPESRPFKSKRVRVSKIEFESLLLISGQEIYLSQRSSEGLMASMWELPAQAAGDFVPWPDLFKEPITFLGKLPKPVVHRFTHLHATYHVSVFRSGSQVQWREPPRAYAQSRWIDMNAFQEIPITNVLQKMLPELTVYLKGESPCPNKPSTLPGMRNTK